MSRRWLAAGLALILGAWFGQARLAGLQAPDLLAGAPTIRPPATSPATSSPTSSGASPAWSPLEIFDDSPRATLILATGEMPADDAVFAAGHEPNGPFWDGVATWLMRTRMPGLQLRVEFNSEAGMFCAYGDRAALERLGTAMAEVARDPARATALISEAESAGFFFDD
jgi:hypothetical protein